MKLAILLSKISIIVSLWILLLDVTFEYIINREVHIAIQILVLPLLISTAIIVINQINKLIIKYHVKNKNH